MVQPAADVGVFGGSGFYSFLSDVTTVEVDTPYGSPSAPPTIGTVADRRVAFIPRHGMNHEHPPHKIPARANLWAMRELGVKAIYGPCATGSLRPDIEPTQFVVCDQLVDRTWGREHTFFDGPTVHHVAFADPYCETLRSVAVTAGREAGVEVHDSGTMVVVQGPRFSTRAESQWFRSMGWDVVGMTQIPEALLAFELGICYATIALVTDYDTGVEHDPDKGPVTMDEVLAVMAENVDHARDLLFRAIAALPDPLPDCSNQTIDFTP